MDKIFKTFIGPSSKSSTTNNNNTSSASDSGVDSSASHSGGNPCPTGKDASSSSHPSSSTTSPSKSSSNCRLDDPEVRLEEKLRHKAFAHYDCQSMTASINGASDLQVSLSKRRNTTTGASAASMVAKNPSLEGADEGDGKSNHLILSCPYFRNELGGEGERVICLSRATASTDHQSSVRKSLEEKSNSLELLHRPNMASGLALLEDANERRWRLKSCPYQRLTNEKSFIIENFDIGATYYREHFYGLEHQNWFGVDDSLGPIAVSIRKERIIIPVSASSVTSPISEVTSPVTPSSGPASLTSKDGNSDTSNQSTIKYQYRLIVRTSELSVLRGCVFEACIPGLSSSSSRHNHHLNHHAKEVLEYLFPDISLASLRLGVLNADEQLLKLDEQVLTTTYKVGVLYCRDGQSTEEEMYNNEHSSPAFDEFLTVLGEMVRLKGFAKYRAGLDNKTDTTGTHSIYNTYNDCEIMFHVSTLLPFTANNKQQLLRKRHIGNDIVTIIFQEANAKPFTPKTIRSHFQHVFIVVRQLPSSSSSSHHGNQAVKYAVSVSRSKEVPVFGPPIPDGGVFTKSKPFSEFLLSKIINAENAAHRSEKFRSMAQRTRHEYLKDLASNYVTNTTINDVSIGTSAGAKLVSSIFGASKKSRSLKSSQFIGDAVIKGAILWDNMSVEDFGQGKACDCVLGISSDTFLIMEEPNKEVIFVIPNASILGWSSHPSYIKIYYHQGECILIKCKDPDLDEIAEIVSRLRCVSPGVETQEMILRRNAAGQLGFHVNHEGIVTEVEEYAFAWQVGLRSNFRIVEICKVAIATLDLDQVQDLLKTSMTVSVTVVPPNSDGSPRRGCNLTNCSYLTSILLNGDGGEYENISGLFERTTLLASDRRKKGRFATSSFKAPLTNVSSIPPSSSSSHPHAVHHQSFVGSRSTPVSPEQPFSVSSRATSGMSSMRVKASTLKTSPTSAFSSLTPAISLSEFSHHSAEGSLGGDRDARYGFGVRGDRNDMYYTGHHQHPHLTRHYLPGGGPLVKTRSEISLTNPSPPPSFSYGSSQGSNAVAGMGGIQGRRRYPSPSRSHSQHFPVKPPNSLVLSSNNNNMLNMHHPPPPQTKQLPQQMMQQPPPKPKLSSSGYYSDSSSNEVWSLPPYHASSRNTSVMNGVTASPASSLERRGSQGGFTGHVVYHRDQHPILQASSSMTASSSYQSQRPVNLYSSNGNSSVASRSASERLRMRSGSKVSSSSNPVNGSVAASNLQQDLLKLISPDTNEMSCTVNDVSSNHSGAETGSATQFSTPYSSLERQKINGGDIYTNDSQQNDYRPHDVVIAAQPAQVLPSSSSSHEVNSSKTVVQSSSVGHHPSPVAKPPRSQTLSSFPVNNDIDWPSLVDTATRAIAFGRDNNEEERDDGDDDSEIMGRKGGSRRAEDSLKWLNDFASTSSTGGSPSKTPTTTTSSSSDVNGGASLSLPPESLRNLEATVEKLQSDLVREQTTNANLEEEVNKLKEENQRLQEESQTAAAQLRKFTEWFFQNINAK